MGSDTNPCFSFLQVINRFLSPAMKIMALVIGFLYIDCNEEMSTWLLVSGFMAQIIFILVMILICCCALLSIFLAMRSRSDEASIISLSLPSIIFDFIIRLTIIIFSIFSITWTIYGAVLFFPVASGPYPICNDEKNGKVLVVTGTIIVAFKII